jgi:HlyD family secretion protein
MSKRARLILVFALVALGAVGVFFYWQRSDRAEAGVLKVSGNIEVTSAEISFKIPGRVLERLVDEGDGVKQGQPIARLEASDIRQQLAVRQAAVAEAQAAYDEMVAGSRPEEIAAAAAALERARADAELARLELARQRDMFERKLTSAQAFDTARANSQAADAAAREAEQQLRLKRKGSRAEDIEQARARLEQARQNVALAQTQLDYAEIDSPLTGVVLSKNVEPGEYVSPGTPVVTVAELDRPWVRAYVSESDLGHVKLGQAARVRCDSFPGKVYEGRVSFIASEAEFTPKNVETRQERVKLVYRIKVDIANRERELKPGMPADVEIATAP